MVTAPVASAVQRYHTSCEICGSLKKLQAAGSAGPSVVAFTVVKGVAVHPEMTAALAQASLGGPAGPHAGPEMVRLPLPTAVRNPPRRMRYCAPLVAVNESCDCSDPVPHALESSLQASAVPETVGQAAG